MKLDGWKRVDYNTRGSKVTEHLTAIVGALLAGPAVGLFTGQAIQGGAVKMNVPELLNHAEALLLATYKRAEEINADEVPNDC